MMTATPALSSAPSSVVPSVVMSVLPTSAASSGLSATRITRSVSPGSTMSPPAIVADHLRLHVRAGRLGRGVEVRIERHHGRAAGRRVAGTVASDDAILVLPRVGQAHRLQLVDQQPAQFQLAGRAGIRRRRLRGPWCRFARSAKTLEQPLGDSWS